MSYNQAEWIDGNTLRSGTLSYTTKDRTPAQDMVGGSLRLLVSKYEGAFEVLFPVGAAASGAIFSEESAGAVRCSSPVNASAETGGGFLRFFFNPLSPDPVEIQFDRIICDTGEGVSLVLVKFNSETVVLPVYRVLGEQRIFFFGDTCGGYLSEIKLQWRAENLPDNAYITIVPSADTVSGVIRVHDHEGEIYIPLLYDTVFMLTVYTHDGHTVATLFHKVILTKPEVLEFDIQEAGDDYHVRYLLKNQRYAFMNMGVGRLDASKVWEENGDVYAEFDGIVRIFSYSPEPALIFAPCRGPRLSVTVEGGECE